FSHAKFPDPPDAPRRVETQLGDRVGTLAYMPPEQADGRGRWAGPPADVYSLGATLYELLIGRPPFYGSADEVVLRQIAQDRPVPPRSLRPEIPPDLETVCLKCLEKRPEHRYPTAAALADDLKRFLKGDPIHARPPGRVVRGWRWLQRHPGEARLLGLVAGLIALLVVGSVAAAVYYQGANERERNLNKQLVKEVTERKVKGYFANLVNADVELSENQN